MNGPSWYDVLGVEPDASTDEVRAAWRAASADADPGTARFRSLAAAAEVLLDPDRRAAYDATLETATLETATLETATPAAGPEQVAESVVEHEADTDSDADSGSEASEEGEPAAADPRRGVPTWLLAALAVAVVALLAATAWAYRQWGADDVEQAASAARSAAERAVVPVLSYDAADLDADQARAQRYLTGDYRAEYDQLFALIQENAPGTGTKVEVEVLASAIVRAEADRVQVLLFVDRPTTNKQTTEPVVYRDQVTLTMAREGGEWLVDDLVTSPVEQ